MTDPAPFQSTSMTVIPEWIDFNGHLNMAYYNVLFDLSGDQAYAQLGFGEEYVKARGFTTYMAEVHVCYVRELHEGDRVYCTFQLLDHNDRSIHTYQELFHEDGWLAATCESLCLHVDMSGPKVAPFPDDIARKVIKMRADHADLPLPARASRSIAIRHK